MNKKRLIIVIVAAVVFAALVVTGILLLAHKPSIQVAGSVTGTIGVNNIEKPDNIDDLLFGISVSAITNSGAGLRTAQVKNGETITIADDAKGPVTLRIWRNDATSDFLPDNGLNEAVVYETTIPNTLVWELGDVISTVDWSDDFFDNMVKVDTVYSVYYTDSCLGQHYVSQLNVTYMDTDGIERYMMYSASLSVEVE